MAISNPNHWMEDYKFKGPKYDKITEIIAALNTLEDHGNLSGLADDDHTQYLNIARHDLTARHGAAVVDHGGIGGLGDDDHSQYIKEDGTRPFSGDQSMGSHKLTSVTDPTLAQDAATKNYVDAHAISGEVFIPGSNFIPGVFADMGSDGVNTIINDITDTFIQGFLPLASQMTIGGTTKYLKITSVRVNWQQSDAADDLDRFFMRRFISGSGTAQTCLDDTTNRGVAGYNSYTYSITVNNTLNSTYDIFSIAIFYIKTAGGASAIDWRFQGCMITYEYV